MMQLNAIRLLEIPILRMGYADSCRRMSRSAPRAPLKIATLAGSGVCPSGDGATDLFLTWLRTLHHRSRTWIPDWSFNLD